MSAVGPVAPPPKVVVRLGDQPLAPDLLQGLTEVRVEQQLGRPAQLLLVAVADCAGDDILAGETPIDVRVDGHDVGLLTGTITGIERRWHPDGHRTMTLRAHDALHRLRGERRAVAHERTSVVDLARRMVESHGIAWESAHSSPEQPALHQSGETDLGFLRRVLATTGLHLTDRDGTVHLVDGAGTGAEIELRPGHELIELSIDERAAGDPGTDVTGWDASRVLGVRSGGAASITGWMVDDAAARQLSGALAMRAGASQLVAHAVAIGDCRLRPATRIRLAAGDAGQPDAAPNRSGPLTITRASHRIDAAGYVTELSTEPADPAPVPAPATVTLGRVFDVDDPLGMARVRVELPALGDLVTAWMPVVCAGAGPGAGIVALPPVGASVAVLGPADQPGRGVVVGGLFGDDRVPGPPVAGGHSRRIALSVSDGPRAVLDGETSEVVFDNGDGSRLELSPRGVTFLAGADLEIAAPGRRIVIRADAIELERG